MFCVFCSKSLTFFWDSLIVPTYHTLSLPLGKTQCWPRSQPPLGRRNEGGRAMNKGYHPAVPPARRKALVDARCTLLGTEQASRASVDGDT